MVKAVFKSINKTERMQRRDFNNQFALYNISQNISHCEMQNCFDFNLRYFAEIRINLINVLNSQFFPSKNAYWFGSVSLSLMKFIKFVKMFSGFRCSNWCFQRAINMSNFNDASWWCWFLSFRQSLLKLCQQYHCHMAQSSQAYFDMIEFSLDWRKTHSDIN